MCDPEKLFSLHNLGPASSGCFARAVTGTVCGRLGQKTSSKGPVVVESLDAPLFHARVQGQGVDEKQDPNFSCLQCSLSRVWCLVTTGGGRHQEGGQMAVGCHSEKVD